MGFPKYAEDNRESRDDRFRMRESSSWWAGQDSSYYFADRSGAKRNAVNSHGAKNIRSIRIDISTGMVY